MDLTLSTASHSDEMSDPREVCLGVRILAHPDPARVGDYAALIDIDRDGTALLSRNVPEFRTHDGRCSGPLNTEHVSRTPVQIERRGSRFTFRWHHPNAAVEINGTALAGDLSIDLESSDTTGMTVLLGKHVALWIGRLEISEPVQAIAGLVGESAPMRKLRREILRIADTTVPVLLRGETGVGKEIVAASMHALSGRASRRYVAVNVAALPASVAAAELFGHKRGAFTGATNERRGYFAEADHGTLFLDEIGDVTADVQALLLRAIQHGTIQPLGGNVQQVDVRLIAATDSDLEAAVARGSFREPLLRRFSYEMYVPPLRDRRDDIGLLFNHLLRQQLARIEKAGDPSPFTERTGRWVPASFIARLARHDWPGNVRELANVALQFALYHRDKPPTRVDPHLESLLTRRPVRQRRKTPQASMMPTVIPPPPEPNLDLSDAEIERVLSDAGFSTDRAAKHLGVSRAYLFKRISESPSLPRARDLSPDDIRLAIAAENGDRRAAAIRLKVSPRALALQITRLDLDA